MAAFLAAGLPGGYRETQKLHHLNYFPLVSPSQVYSVERNGQQRQVTISTMRFTWTDLFITFGIPFLCGVIYFSIGTIVFTLRPNTAVSWTFLLVCTCLGIYTITAFDTQSTHWGFTRLFIFVLTLFPAALLHLGLLFPEKQQLVQHYPSLPFILYLSTAALLVPFELLYPNSAFEHIYRVVFAFLAFSGVALVLLTLRTYLQSASAVAKTRAMVILLGVALAFPAPLVAQYMSIFGRVEGMAILINYLVLLCSSSQQLSPTQL